jgi:type I restriction enzyme S subunit
MNAILDKFSPEIRYIKSVNIKLGDSRIDPQFYSANQNFIGNLTTIPLSFFCEEIFNPSVFKREFVLNSTECRYLASSEIVSQDPDITYITNEQANRLNLKVKEGWVMVTGFGTIGSIRMVDKTIAGYAVANNVTRIVAKPGYSGFVATFLQSPSGNRLLNDHAAGAVVKYIEAPQIAKLPIPSLDDATIEKINEAYLTSVQMREEAKITMNKAIESFHRLNRLPILSNSKEANNISSDSTCYLTNTSKFSSAYRLDAHYYNRQAETAIQIINQSCLKIGALGDANVTQEIFYLNRFTRTFVEESYGIPYLAGKDLTKLRPSDVSYLSRTETEDIDTYALKKGWILMTCSGTLAKVSLVWNNFENWVATHDLIRIVPASKIDSGYLFAFLHSQYGYQQAQRFKHGAVVDHLTPEQLEEILVPIPESNIQFEIGQLVRASFDLRARANKLENEAIQVLNGSLK